MATTRTGPEGAPSDVPPDDAPPARRDEAKAKAEAAKDPNPVGTGAQDLGGAPPPPPEPTEEAAKEARDQRVKRNTEAALEGQKERDEAEKSEREEAKR